MHYKLRQCKALGYMHVLIAPLALDHPSKSIKSCTMWMPLRMCAQQVRPAHRSDPFTLLAQMYVVAVGMILGAMNRLPIKLPRRGPGRRHSSGSSLQQTVSFADVAGVDEAKEELSEIVVCDI